MNRNNYILTSTLTVSSTALDPLATKNYAFSYELRLMMPHLALSLEELLLQSFFLRSHWNILC